MNDQSAFHLRVKCLVNGDWIGLGTQNFIGMRGDQVKLLLKERQILSNLSKIESDNTKI